MITRDLVTQMQVESRLNNKRRITINEICDEMLKNRNRKKNTLKNPKY